MKAILTVILPLMIFLISCNDNSSSVNKADLSIGAQAPGFSVESNDGGKISLEQFKGKVVLLDFWASWCGPCVEGIPGLKALAEKYKNDDFILVSISYDHTRDTWKNFVKNNNMTWQQAFDGNGVVKNLYDVTGIPWAYLIDQDGKIIYSGYMYAPTIDPIISEHLEN